MIKQISAKTIVAMAAGALMMSVRFAAFGQEPIPVPVDLKLASSAAGGQQLSYLDANGMPTSPTKPCLESLPGNGTRAGYMLSHGGIVPISVRVSVGARSLRSGVDYSLDYASGMLFFSEPVRRFETITVSYEYVLQADGNRTPGGANSLALNYRGASLNFGFGMSSFNGLDFNTYGLSMTSKVGQGGTLKGLLYFSTPAASNLNVLGRTDANQTSVTKRNADAARSDHLIVQEFNTRVGSASVRATYQDIGMNFGGFQAMRQANAGNAEVLGQIGVLEKERGIRRLGFGTSVPVSGNGKLGFDWDRTSDGKGEIAQRKLSINSGALSFSYMDLNIGRNFEGFQRLREGEAPQWARERGIHRSALTLGLTPSKTTSLGFGQTTLRDASGSMLRQSLQMATGGFGVSYYRSSTDAQFRRLNDLSDAEKTEMALEVRRQFNPGAKAAEVTPQERQQIAGEAGIDRTRLSLNGNLGKAGSLSLGKFEVSDGSGAIRRSTLSFQGRGFEFSYLDQSIDKAFSRLGALNQFERAQYGNELGIRRTALNFRMALNQSTGVAYQQSSIRDEAGGMSRQSVSYQGKGVTAQLNMASTDASFARARDLAGLSDPEKAAIEAERGFKRTDFAADITAIRGLKLNTYTYNAFNAEQAISLNRFRHFADWTVSRNTRVTYITEGNSLARESVTANGVNHSLLTFDHNLGRGMKLNMYRDAVTTVQGAQSTTVTTNFAHFETDRSKPNNLMFETKRVSSTAGTFENTTQLDLNYRASRALGLRFNYLDVDRGENPSARTNTIALDWQINRQLRFAGSYATTSTNNNQDAIARSFSLSGNISPTFTLTGTYSEAGLVGKPLRTASDISIANTKPFSFLGLTNTTMAFKYTALGDQGRKLSQLVVGSLAANLGRNQLALEYGGSLDQKNNRAVSRQISFVSDRNEKLPLHFDISYRARNINGGPLQLTRRYNFSYRMDRQTSMTYTYASLPDGPNGQLQPLTTSAFALKRNINPASSFTLDYTTNRDFAKGTIVRKLGANYQTKLRNLAAVQVGYSVDISNLNGQNVNAHTLSLGYDRRVSADNVVAFAAAYTMNHNGQPNDLRGTVEFRTRF